MTFFRNFAAMKRWLRLPLVALVCALLSGCISQRHTVLVQDAVPEDSIYVPMPQVTEKYVLCPNDYLFINVTCPSEELSKFYNPASSSRGGNNITAGRSEFYYYGLDDDCCIDFPVTGKIDLKGCNIKEAKQRINQAISKTLTGFTLVVRLASNSFTILGEIARQGMYTMTRDQVTIFDAVAMAGGFTTYAKRKEVKLFRKDEKGQMICHVVDMTKGRFIDSEWYFIYPNDVIYIRPLWHKKLGWGESFSIGFISSLLSLVISVVTFVIALRK